MRHVRLIAGFGAVVLVAVAVLVAAGTGLGPQGGRPAPPPAPSTAPSSCHRIAVPAYFDPTDSGAWPTVTSAGARVAYVIMNPGNGPGRTRDPTYSAAVRRSRAAGQRVLGYVPTNYGRRPASAVRADIARYREWYGVRNIFLDEAPTRRGRLATYRSYAASIHAGGGIVVLNPGTLPARSYFGAADAVVTFDGPARAYERSADTPAWLERIPRAKVWTMVMATTGAALERVLATARSRHAGLVYVTDDRPPNPWDRLPTYWSHELHTASRSCPVGVGSH
ncbi:MAG: spherulation-specific family 4 protein [Streptosporangiaceae bacterium]